MQIRSKLAAAAVAAGFLAGGVIAASPASANVINVSCPTNGVEVYSTQGNYCYAGDPHGGDGWANIYNSYAVMSHWNNGHVHYWTTGGYGITQEFYANGQTYWYVDAHSRTDDVTIYG